MNLKHAISRPITLLLAISMLCSQAPVNTMAAAGSESESRSTSVTMESHTVTGFKKASSCLGSFTFSVSQKPSLSALKKKLPSTLDVYLDNSSKATSIPVTWFCAGEDYESSDADYFQFSPQWDEHTYKLSNNMDLYEDAPYIGIFLADGLSRSGMTSSASSNYEKEIFNFLIRDMKLNNAAACGVMANIYHESGFNPRRVGDGGTSYGICQWHNSRYTALRTWCKSKGYDYTTLNGQLNYLKFELSQNSSRYLWNGKTIYSNISKVKNTAQGAYDAAYYWCYYFEVPANRGTVSVTRGNLARNHYWPVYSKTTATASTTTQKTSITACKASLSAKNYTCTGKKIKPAVTVKNGTKTLKNGTDYTVSYINNVNAGTASVIIKGKGNYTGEATLAFGISLKTPALSKVSNTASGVQVTWSAVPGATGYYVYHKLPGGKWIRLAKIKSAKTTSYVDEDAAAGKTWLYTVKAFDQSGNNSGFEKGLSIYSLTQRSISSLSNSSSKKITVKWKKDSNAQGYQIQYATKSNFSNQKTKTITKNSTVSYTTSGFTKNKTYYVRIRSYKKVDGVTYYSAWSKTKNIKVTR